MSESSTDQPQSTQQAEHVFEDHIALIYESAEERLAAVTPLIKVGLDKGELCLYISNEDDDRALVEALRAQGVDVEKAMASGGLIMAVTMSTSNVPALLSVNVPPEMSPEDSLFSFTRRPSSFNSAAICQPGRDIWLYGGGSLFSQLLAWNLVDTVEPAVIPILLGGGVKLLSPHGLRQYLALVGHRAYPSGMLFLEYEVIQTAEDK
jgi:riboflavin biosynthesis pyrimidine reductase